MNHRIAHAYLFCGSRGTGKTSTAKIMARAVNCLSPVDGNPCGRCDVCTKLSDESNMDIIEIDAASNNGVDEIRDLREKVKYPPTIGSYKIYIIDEVHMLSTGAFNALLKTLEEPPQHVIFILATTEPHRLPATILSRCQRYDFRRIGEQDMVERMRVILAAMEMHAEDEALRLIARSAQGAMRDALSMLDQALSFCDGNIGYADVLDMLGASGTDFIAGLIDAVIAGDDGGALSSIDQAVEQGRDLTALVREIAWYVRDLMIVKSCRQPETMIWASQHQMDIYKAQADKIDEQKLVAYMDILSVTDNQLRFAAQPRITVEMMVIKLCHLREASSMDAIVARMDMLEGKLDRLMNSGGTAGAERQSAQTEPAQQAKPIPKKPKAADKPPAQPASVQNETKAGGLNEVMRAWSAILQAVKKEKMTVYTFLCNATPTALEGEQLTLAFPEGKSIFAAAIEKDENRQLVEKAISAITGKELRVKCITGQSAAHESAKDVDIVEKAKELFGEDKVEVIDD
ncbi:MAG: polymerase subunit gamma and tau [Mahella sp.]|nr:polymerase subunit gamma and tau [Mahella sp.]